MKLPFASCSSQCKCEEFLFTIQITTVTYLFHIFIVLQQMFTTMFSFQLDIVVSSTSCWPQLVTRELKACYMHMYGSGLAGDGKLCL